MLLFLCLSCYGQTVIEYANNAPLNGDSIQKRRVNYFCFSNEGKNVLWDFSKLTALDQQLQTTHFDIKDSVIYSLDDKTINKYKLLSKDTLKLIGYETRFEQMNYSKPLIAQVYPFAFGDKATSYYEGIGSFCQNLIIKKSGTQIVEAKAYGKIITETEDTLKNVIRLHTIRSSSVGMYDPKDSLFTDSTYIKQEIKDINQWYVQGYRYPLYETISTAYYDHLDLISTINAAYVYAFEKNKIKEDNEQEKKGNLDTKVIFHYKISFENNKLVLSFSLDEDSNVNTLICNVKGMLYLNETTNKPKGTGYQFNYDMDSLPKGIYVLYINVNGKIYSEKFSNL